MLGAAEQPVDLEVEQAFFLEACGELARVLEQVAVGAKPGEMEIGEPRLTRPEELALTADLEVSLGELEPVGRLDESLEPLRGPLR